ncbi:MAG: hypothetical protein SFW62_02450 [Alphaproteobacteria bacterium]|nr:hypothetical protein [Alphaproteobacteria bacterium]
MSATFLLCKMMEERIGNAKSFAQSARETEKRSAHQADGDTEAL